MQDILNILVKWIHVSSACVLVGAVALALWGILPGVRSGGDAPPANEILLKRFSMLIHSSLGLLLLTGIYNFWGVLQKDALNHSASYQGILGAKILLFIVVFVLGILLTRAHKASGLGARSGPFLTWMMILSLVIVLLSSILNIKRVELLSGPVGTAAFAAPKR
ncbi:MAG: hypothetical protein M3Y56_07365 [Armatimonadota bacterium]|nr:hypothetical protein [Armatimonadota bacterium]